MSDAKSRPSQVTFSAWTIIGGSVLLLLLAFDAIANLRSLEQRTMVERMLSEPPLAGLGIGVESMLGTMRVAALVAGGCAAATAILGYQVLKRDRLARLVLTMLAAPVFLAGLVTGGFISSVVVVSVVLLWAQPSRDWFNGVAPTAAVARHPSRHPSGQAGPAPPGMGAFTALPRGMGEATAGAPAVVARPGGVLWACVLTWVSSGLVTVMMLASLGLILTTPEQLLAEAQRQYPDLTAQGVTADLLSATAFVVVGLTVLWSVAASVVAYFAFRRRSWARISLMVSAGAVGVLCVLASANALLFIVPLVAAALTVTMLMRPEVRTWYASAPPVRGPMEA